MWGYCGPKTLAALAREWGVEVAAAPGGEVDSGYLQCKRVDAGNAEYDGTGKYLKEVVKNNPLHTGPRPKRGINGKVMANDEFGEPMGHTGEDYVEGSELRFQDVQQLAGRAVTLERASTNFVRAVMGAVYLHCGAKTAKNFFNMHISSRDLKIGSLFEFRQPTRDLSRLCAREGFESPVARILSETGRRSRHPVFVVGVFSGKDKLGEGQGGSLDEARIRAAIAALKGWYLYSPLEVRVPSEMEVPFAKPWDPVMIDGGEVIV